eukprot:CAMPEP_0170430078 /NCGR_PEP_ID=MMETSP0117_2-20130122/40661_1 /TAXON_ID=400756 /ORGANISM="Durinskia baltica, Strain CSIRO CS-38" /LENGTH=97 /DNA_ID=CAMNT_0010689513 /DNA_START=63 /DNA_END=357 /DNA_ORIENTATION=-
MIRRKPSPHDPRMPARAQTNAADDGAAARRHRTFVLIGRAATHPPGGRRVRHRARQCAWCIELEFLAGGRHVSAGFGCSPASSRAGQAAASLTGPSS